MLAYLAPVAGVMMRLSEYSKSAAVTGSPFDQRAFARKWKV